MAKLTYRTTTWARTNEKYADYVLYYNIASPIAYVAFNDKRKDKLNATLVLPPYGRYEKQHKDPLPK